ncbi:MAG: glycosyltransferase family 2 protein [Holophagales bacterium]|nr:glycosyltransferase family 2 protein [Holophagales bacterium]
MPGPSISVVVPAYNEEQRLGSTLRRLTTFFEHGDAPYQILVVDDGSRDATSEVARSFAARGVELVELPSNRGKGGAIQAGVAHSHGDRVLVTDADLSTPIEDLRTLEPHLKQAEVVVGSRAVGSSRVTQRQPLYRELMGKVFNRLIHLMGVRGIRDTQCGFKLFEGEVARRLFALTITPGFAYDVEIVWLARHLGYRVAEVGVRWENSPSSRVNPLLDPPRMLLEIVRFRWHHRHLDRQRTKVPGT